LVVEGIRRTRRDSSQRTGRVTHRLRKYGQPWAHRSERREVRTRSDKVVLRGWWKLAVGLFRLVT
jgi:hypothetical protein